MSSGWRDIGYNFLVDKCGNIYEGRAGGVAKAVMGAHTLGFNTDSMGIAVLGSFGTTKPSGAAVTAIAKLTAWKLGLFGANPKGKTYLKSGGGNLYRKGKERTTERDLRPSGRVRHRVPGLAALQQARLGPYDSGPYQGR